MIFDFENMSLLIIYILGMIEQHLAIIGQISSVSVAARAKKPRPRIGTENREPKKPRIPIPIY